MILALVLALSAVSVVSAQTGVDTNPSGTVTCTETGYSPIFTYTPANINDGITNVDVEITLGSSGADDCKETITNLAKGSETSMDEFDTLLFATCGGSLADSDDESKIQYVIEATIKVSETVRTIIREYSYIASVECSLTRQYDPIKGVFSFVVDRAGVSPARQTAITNEIPFDIDVNFYDSAMRSVKEVDDTSGSPGNQFNVIMGAPLYIRLEENPASTVFKFVTNKCYFNHDTTNNGQTNADVFFDDQCMVDKDTSTNSFSDKTSQNDDYMFDMTVKSFFFTGQASSAVHLFCEVYVCRTADPESECLQKDMSACGMLSRRKRRSISGSAAGPIETRIVESKQVILLDKNDVIVPSCGEGFVYDRVTKGCSNNNLLDIIGLYLDIPWNNDYSNKSSLAYKNLAIEKAYQLYAMVQMSEAKNHIVGLEVVDAKKGSVILTVRVKYSAMSNADAAFEGFVRAIQNVDQTRVANILNIRKEKVIEFVEIKPASASQINIQTLIILVVVLCAAVLISFAVVWKVKMARRAPNSNMPQVKAHDNPTLETVS